MQLWDYVKRAAPVKVSNRFSALTGDAAHDIPGNGMGKSAISGGFGCLAHTIFGADAFIQ